MPTKSALLLGVTFRGAAEHLPISDHLRTTSIYTYHDITSHGEEVVELNLSSSNNIVDDHDNSDSDNDGIEENFMQSNFEQVLGVWNSVCACACVHVCDLTP